jgi:hypothetical protein
VHFQRASGTRRRSGPGPSGSRGSPASGDVRAAHAATPAQIAGRGDFDGAALACRCANDAPRSASGSILARWCAPRAIRSATGTPLACHCASGAIRSVTRTPLACHRARGAIRSAGGAAFLACD